MKQWFTSSVCHSLRDYWNLDSFMIQTLILDVILFFWDIHLLTHWGRVTNICVSKLTSIGSDNGLSPGPCQAIIWTNAGIVLFGHLGTNFDEIVTKIIHFYLIKCILEMPSREWRPFRFGLDVLNASPEYIRTPNLDIAASADTIAPFVDQMPSF